MIVNYKIALWRYFGRLALPAVFLLLVSARVHADLVRDMDVFAWRKSASAQSWTPGFAGMRDLEKRRGVDRVRKILSPLEGEAGGTRFSCAFRTIGVDRVYWDKKVDLNLSDFDVIELDLTCNRPDAVRTIGLYLKTGDGWRLWLEPLDEVGRRKMSFPIKSASVEGRPGGWDKITDVRLSFTSSLNEDVIVDVHALRAIICNVTVVEGSLSVKEPGERNAARGAARRVSRWLSELGVSYAVIDDGDVIAGKLRNSRVAILPYNPEPPEKQIAALSDFIKRGGKLLVFYSSSQPLAKLMNVRLGDYKMTEDPGQWSGLVFNRNAPAHLPAFVGQQSRNIRVVYPDVHGSRIIAYWQNERGDVISEPALAQSRSGFWMSHILLDGDNENKKRLLLGLLGHCDYFVWMQAAQHAIGNVGKVGGYQSFHGAVTGISRRAGGGEQGAQIRVVLASAGNHFERMRQAWMSRDYPEVVEASSVLRRDLVEGYARVHKPKKGEFRAVWNHSGTGLYSGDWDRTCALLARNGFNVVFPNVLWPGVSHYPSDVTIESFSSKSLGDQLESCIKAANRYGLQVHAWKVCWNLESSNSSDFVRNLEKQGRLQRTKNGDVLRWLCPSHPENIAMELAAIEDLARRYKVDGVHLDYVRYPNVDACYCDGCRRRFESDRGHPARFWPESAFSGDLRDEYMRWRSERITEFVRLARQTLRRVNREIKLSAAVYPGYPGCVRSVGQDWGLWLKEGIVDFVCPMNYVSDMGSFRQLVDRQLALPGARGRIFPGIGVTAIESRLTADKVIDQIELLRRAGAGGFVLFDLNREVEREILPTLGLGVTRSEKD